MQIAAWAMSTSLRVVSAAPGSANAATRALSAACFDFLAFGFSALLLWHFIRLEISSYRFGERAPTYLETPLWIPRMAMAIGAAALCFSIIRTFLAHVRRFQVLSRPHGT